MVARYYPLPALYILVASAKMIFSREVELALTHKESDWENRLSAHQIAASLFVLLMAVYSLTYSGTFITDDEHILASRAFSMAFDGQLNDQRVYGNQRVYALSDTTPVYAAQGVNIEPGQAFAGSILARLAAGLEVGRVQTIFLLNIWITALTAVVVYYAVLFHDYRKFTALIIALLFGLGTMVWPYTRTYFRDPLAMFCLSFAWLCMLSLVRADQNNYIKRLSWVGLIAGLVAGVLTKNTIVLAFPVFLIYFLVKNDKTNIANYLTALNNNRKRTLLYFGGILIFLLLWVKLLPPDGVFARFTLEYYMFVLRKFVTAPHLNIISALAGPLFSPSKSVFLYSPAIILSLLGLLYNFKLAWSSWLYLFLLIIGQALFYDENWFGHINWGLRFLVPSLPLLIIAAAPVVERCWVTKKGQISLIIIGSVSVLVQLIGVLPPVKGYYIEMTSIATPELASLTTWSFKYSALVWHLKWILSGGYFDLPVMRIGGRIIPVLLGFSTLLGLAVIGLLKGLRPWLQISSLLLCVYMMILMLFSYSEDPAYFYSRYDLEAAQEKISENYRPGDTVLIKSYGTPAWYYWMNWSNPDIQWISLPFFYPAPSLIEKHNLIPNPELIMDELTLSLLNTLPGSTQRIWLVAPSDTPGASLNLEADWLESRSVSSNNWIFTAGPNTTRLFLFNKH